MDSRLFVSFWEQQLDNLSDGLFSKRRLAAAEARLMITAARSAGALHCVSGTDLLAPYKKRELRHHRQLCAALAQRHDINITVEDFIGAECEALRGALPLALPALD